MSGDAEAPDQLASHRRVGSCMLWGDQRAWGFIPQGVLTGCPILGHYGVHPMDALSSEDTHNDGCLTPHPASVSLLRWAGRVLGGLVCLLCPVALAWGRQGPWGWCWAQGGALWQPQVALQSGWLRGAREGADDQTSNARACSGTAPQGTDAGVAAREGAPRRTGGAVRRGHRGAWGRA